MSNVHHASCERDVARRAADRRRRHSAQSTLPPRRRRRRPRRPPASRRDRGEEIVVTGSRIRRDPLSQDAPIVFVDQTTSPRPASPRSTTSSSACPARAAGSTASSTIRATSAIRPTAAASAPARRKSTCATSARAACSCSSTACASSTAPRPAACPARPTSTRSPKARSSGSKCCRTAPRRSTARTRSPAWSTSSPSGSRRASWPRPRSAAMTRATASPRITSCSWGNGGDGPLQVVVGGNYVKQNPVSTADRAISLFPEPYPTLLADGDCSSFTAERPLHRSAFVGGNATLIAPVTRPAPRRRPISAASSARPTGSISRRSTSADPARAARRVRQCALRDCRQPQLLGQGRSATGASRRTRRRRCRSALARRRA